MSDINKMDFKDLRNEVQTLRDELAIMKRKYEDIIYNLDTDNFSSRFVKEQGDMRTAVEITAEGIKTKVSKDDFESAIAQTASNIKSIVSKNISVKFKKSSKPTRYNTTDAEKGMLCEYDDTLYYYNDITETWKEYPYADGITSQFLQTAYGFELTGDVSISGDAIVGGTIQGVAVESKDSYDNTVVLSDGHLQLIPNDYSTSLVDLGIYNMADHFEPRMRFGIGTDESVSNGTGWIYKTQNGFGMMYNTEEGNAMSIEFNNFTNAIEILGDVNFRGGEVTGLPISGGYAVFG